MKIEVTHSQFWLIMRGLLWLSSEEGETRLMTEYPHLDPDGLEKDFHELMDKLEAVNARQS